MKVFFPPNPYKPDGCYTVFLAGSIEMGKAEDWQERFIQHWSGSSRHVNILNPRRHEWDASWEQSIENTEFRGQVEWELAGLARADLILMYIQPDTLSPISMLELGLFADSGKMVVCCPAGFWRKGNIDIVCHNRNIIHCETEKELYRISDNFIMRLA
jgi:hypothetical protein